MRKDMLLGVSFLVALAVVYGCRLMVGTLGYTGSVVSFLSSPLLVSFLIAPILLIVLTPFNQWLLKWRKARGRDIEEEEKYESDGGIISLTRREDD